MQILSLKSAGIIAWSNSKKNNCLFVIYSSLISNSNFIQKATAEYQDQPDANGLLQLFSFDIMNKNSSTSMYSSFTII